MLIFRKVVYLIFVIGSFAGYAQDNNYRIEDYLEGEKTESNRQKPILPSLRKRNSLGLIIVPLVGLGGSYRFQPEKRVGYQTSILNGENSYVLEVSGLFTLASGSTQRIFYKDKKDLVLLAFQSNFFYKNPKGEMVTTHGLGLGVEVIHWRTLSGILKVGGAFYESFEEFNVTMEYGLFYKF